MFWRRRYPPWKTQPKSIDLVISRHFLFFLGGLFSFACMCLMTWFVLHAPDLVSARNAAEALAGCVVMTIFCFHYAWPSDAEKKGYHPDEW